MRNSECVDCRAPHPRSICPECKARRRFLAALHAFARAAECPADREVRGERVAVYAERAAAGEELFDTAKEPGK